MPRTRPTLNEASIFRIIGHRWRVAISPVRAGISIYFWVCLRLAVSLNGIHAVTLVLWSFRISLEIFRSDLEELLGLHPGSWYILLFRAKACYNRLRSSELVDLEGVLNGGVGNPQWSIDVLDELERHCCWKNNTCRAARLRSNYGIVLESFDAFQSSRKRFQRSVKRSIRASLLFCR